MCGRFTLKADINDIVKSFDLKNSFKLIPRYNIAPSQYVPVIRKNGFLEFLMWGLKPQWMREEVVKQGFINARSETIFEKPAFKRLIKNNRCLVLADGYYEWKTINKEKQPFYIRFKDRQVFAFAGLYDGDTVTILTTKACFEIEKIHERMPLVLDKSNYQAWIDKKTKQPEIEKIVNNPFFENLKFGPVTKRVGNPSFDDPSCIIELT